MFGLELPQMLMFIKNKMFDVPRAQNNEHQANISLIFNWECAGSELWNKIWLLYIWYIYTICRGLSWAVCQSHRITCCFTTFQLILFCLHVWRCHGNGILSGRPCKQNQEPQCCSRHALHTVFDHNWECALSKNKSIVLYKSIEQAIGCHPPWSPINCTRHSPSANYYHHNKPGWSCGLSQLNKQKQNIVNEAIKALRETKRMKRQRALPKFRSVAVQPESDT